MFNLFIKKYCPKCGKEISLKTYICNSCNYELTDEEKQKVKMAKMLVLNIIIFSILVLVPILLIFIAIVSS